MKNIFLLFMLCFFGCGEYQDYSKINDLVKEQAIVDGIPFKGCVVMEGDSNTDLIITGVYPNIYNIGVGGSTSYSVVDRINKIKEIQPSVIVLMIGTNDATAINRDNAYTEVDFYNNIQLILNEYKNITNNVYVVSVLPMTPFKILNVNNNPLIKSMNTNLKTITENNGFVFIDKWNDFYDSANDRLKEEYDGDSVHLNDAGRNKHMINVINAL